ncbi:hypothetical protein OE903_13990 [Bacillus sp. B6(2022)]|nr:hypothetical protein [Bacillus sp. B6(2022)]
MYGKKKKKRIIVHVSKIISALLITAGICLVIVGYMKIVDGQRQVDQSFQSAQAAIQQKGKRIPFCAEGW